MATAPPGYKYVKDPKTGKYRLVKLTPKPGATKPAGPAPANPLDTQVNAAVLASTAPLTNAMGLADKQYGAESNLIKGIGSGLQGEIGGIQKDALGRGAAQTGLAADAMQGSQAHYQQNMDFLQNVLGHSVKDLGAVTGAGDLTAGQIASDGTAGVTQQHLNTQGMDDYFTRMKGAVGMHAAEDVGMRLVANSAAKTGYQQRIADAKAQAPFLRRKFAQENLQNRLLQQEANLSKAQAEHQMKIDDSQLTIAQQNADTSQMAATASVADKTGVGVSKYGFKIPKKFEKDIDAIYSSVAQPTVTQTDKATGVTTRVANPARRWQAVANAIEGLGVGRAQAVLLATKWMPERLAANHTTPKQLYAILKGMGLPEPTIKAVFTHYGNHGRLNGTLAYNLRNGVGPGGVVGPPVPGRAPTTGSGTHVDSTGAHYNPNV